MKKSINRFTPKYIVDEETDCWEWTAAKDRDGYGMFYNIDGAGIKAHRWSFWYYRNDEWDKELLVCHHCDNTSCVNPDHLFQGTHNDNVLDKIQKGRMKIGENHGRAVLTEQDVIHIRYNLLTRGLTLKVIADHYGVTTSLISAIKLNHIWTHV